MDVFAHPFWETPAQSANRVNNSAGGQLLGKALDSGNLSWIDAFAPGTTALSNFFDLSGRGAAKMANEAQWAMQKDAQAYNSAEAEKARQFEKDMSDTAYTRAVADLKNAGLNPWLAVQNGGQGASTASGQAASTSQGSASMANNKLAVAAGLIATALRMFLTKGK